MSLGPICGQGPSVLQPYSKPLAKDKKTAALHLRQVEILEKSVGHFDQTRASKLVVFALSSIIAVPTFACIS